MKKPKLIPGLDRFRSFPYFKIQYWNNDLGVWMDIQKSFFELDELVRYAMENIDNSLKTRIIKIEDAKNRIIVNEINAFGVKN